MVGGSLDGQVVRIGGSVYPGMRWPGQTIPGRKREIYVLQHDGKFHFERYGLEPNLQLMRPEVMEAMRPIEERLFALFQELDSFLEKYGGPDNSSITIGNWTIQHKDA